MFSIWTNSGTVTPYKGKAGKIRKVVKSEKITPSKKPVDQKDEASSDHSTTAIQQYEAYLRHHPKREPAINAEQIMTSPVYTLTTGESLNTAWEIIRDYRFRHIPIVSVNKKIVGILSDRDFFKVMMEQFKQDDNSNQYVGDIMSINILSAHPETKIRQIAQVFIDERIGAMPIVHDNGALIGMVTRSDILRTLVNLAPFELWA